MFMQFGRAAVSVIFKSAESAKPQYKPISEQYEDSFLCMIEVDRRKSMTEEGALLLFCCTLTQEILTQKIYSCELCRFFTGANTSLNRYIKYI